MLAVVGERNGHVACGRCRETHLVVVGRRRRGHRYVLADVFGELGLVLLLESCLERQATDCGGVEGTGLHTNTTTTTR